MGFWLLKTDPETYSFADLQRAGRDVWDGVGNNQALIYLRQMKRSDRVFIYHSGKDKRIEGLARIERGAYPDPKLDSEKRVVVELRAEKALPKPVSLADIKADKAFARFELVTISRLSVMPVPAELWAKLCTMGGL